jgi:hypothetical protein
MMGFAACKMESPFVWVFCHEDSECLGLVYVLFETAATTAVKDGLLMVVIDTRVITVVL